MVAYNWFILALIIVAFIAVRIAYRMGREIGHHDRDRYKRVNVNWLLDHKALMPMEAKGWDITEAVLAEHFQDPGYSERRTT